MNSFTNFWLRLFCLILLSAGCGGNNSEPSAELINQLNLKRGQLISCGSPDQEFGKVDFEISCNERVRGEFNTALELLHSFEYEESEKVFSKIIDQSPECAMAYWGVAMCSFHPLWEPPTASDLVKGAKSVEIAISIPGKSKRESSYIDAIAAYYKNWNNTDAKNRVLNFEKAMEQLHNSYPDDKEATIFYSLALNAAADPTDKTYAKQKKAGDLLDALYAAEPNHPGIVHYIIHTYDYPVIANIGLPAARRYAKVAPSSAHALHMPSHIFTRLGLWDDCIESNTQSVAAARCYAEAAGIKAHWDEEMHGLDYLVYAYLQKGDNRGAKEQLNYISNIKEVYPVNFKGAYTFAAAPSRVALENKNWKEASNLQLTPIDFPWNKFPWQASIIHFARLLGAVHLGTIEAAESELAKLNQLYDTLQKRKEFYQSKQVSIQIKTGDAWIKFASGQQTEALQLMKTAADMEDSTSKHPVTPGEVLPAKELLADMYFQRKQYGFALQAYESVLEKSPNRFNSLFGAGAAAEKAGNIEKAGFYYQKIAGPAIEPGSERPELSAAKLFLLNH